MSRLLQQNAPISSYWASHLEKTLSGHIGGFWQLCLQGGGTWETIYEHDDFQMLEPDLDPESDDSDFEFEVPVI